MDRTPGTSQRVYITERTLLSVLMFCVLSILPAQPARMQESEADGDGALIQQMIQLVLEHNPILESADKMVVESRKLHVPSPYFSLNGFSFSLSSAVWNEDLRQFEFSPSFSLGTSISLFDPDKAMASFSVRKEKEVILQDMQTARNTIISDLITRVREIAKLENRKSNLGELRGFLESQSVSIIEQVSIGTMEPDKLWALKERIMNLEIELRDVENQLKMLRLETAMNLGGDSWHDLLTLLEQVGGSL